VELFVRSPYGLTPTEAGELFHNHAQKAVQQLSQLKLQLLNVRRGKREHSLPSKNVIISELLFNYLVVWEKRVALSGNNFTLMGSTDIENCAPDDIVADTVITYAQFRNAHYAASAISYLSADFLGNHDVSMKQVPFLVNSDKRCPFRERTLSVIPQETSSVREVDSWGSIVNLVKAGKGVALLPTYLTETEGLVKVLPKHHFKIGYKTYTRR
jgi:DNA-binding transcriptional LysR family regulator